MTIVEFLLARIAEDEAVAERAVDEWFDAEWIEIDDDPRDHAQHWRPARALVECAAKRRVVELHAQSGERWTGFPRADRLEAYCQHDQHASPCPTLRLVAAVYSDHPDYDQAWRLAAR